MKIETVKISKEFKGLMGGLWLGMESTVSDEEDKIQAFKEGNELLERAYMALNPQINWNERAAELGWKTFPDIKHPLETSPTIEEQEIKIGLTVEDINSCKSKIVCSAYKALLKGDKELEAAWLKKMEEFI